MTDQYYMRRAIELAKKGAGWTNPNPLVGAVIVKDGCIIGEGCHAKYGGLHAERSALASLRESAEGATMYVTLEPCCHYGRQPPAPRRFWRAALRGCLSAPGTQTRWWRARGSKSSGNTAYR